jgi:hypothetical protein
VAPRGAEDVDHLVGVEDRVHGHLLLEEALGVVDLGRDVRAAVDLDLHDVGLLLAELELLHLRVRDDAHDGAVLLDALELAVDVLLAAVGRAVLGRVLGHGLALRLVPVLVEAALHLLGEEGGPDRREGPEAPRRLDVADEADDDHRRRLEHRDGLDDLLLVHLGARAVDVADDVRHARLVRHERREVGRLRRDVAGERAHAAAVVLRALLRQKTEVAVARRLELTVRHGGGRGGGPGSLRGPLCA